MKTKLIINQKRRKKMIRTIMKTGMGILIVIALTIPASAGMKRFGGNGQGKHNSSGQCVIDSIPAGELTQEEADFLLLMREEEKLARDVYLTLYEQYELITFSNIAKSEQRHMDAIGKMLTKYEMEDPIRDNTVGVFTNHELSELYEQLVSKGKTSLLDALIVGATIEDLDIADLISGLEITDDLDVKTVYQNLMKGSRNHLRAFVNQIGINGGEYSPSYISDDVFDAILSTPFERGHYDAEGNPPAGNDIENGRGKGRGKGRGNCKLMTMHDENNDGQILLSRRNGKGSGKRQGSGDGSGNGGGRRQGSGDGTGNGGNCPENGTYHNFKLENYVNV
jgi:hypothetical protein